MTIKRKTPYQHYLKIATDVAQQAGDFLEKNFGIDKKMLHKFGNQFSVKEDHEAGQIYEKYLKEKTPEAAIYNEEGEQNLDAEFVWLIDPIEGTTNYRVGIPFFATQLCLLHNNEPVVTVVYAPILKQFFTAEKNQGAFLNESKIQIAGIKKLKKAVLILGKGSEKQEYLNWWASTATVATPKVRTIRNFGTTGLEMAYLAAGKIDIYLCYGSFLYDYAPGALLVNEAGGVVTNFEGKNWTIKDRDILACNKELHPQILEIVNQDKK